MNLIDKYECFAACCNQFGETDDIGDASSVGCYCCGQDWSRCELEFAMKCVKVNGEKRHVCRSCVCSDCGSLSERICKDRFYLKEWVVKKFECPENDVDAWDFYCDKCFDERPHNMINTLCKKLYFGKCIDCVVLCKK